MANPTKRTTRGKTGKRRAHHALEQVNLKSCEKCGAAVQHHRACANCLTYKGRTVHSM